MLFFSNLNCARRTDAVNRESVECFFGFFVLHLFICENTPISVNIEVVKNDAPEQLAIFTSQVSQAPADAAMTII